MFQVNKTIPKLLQELLLRLQDSSAKSWSAFPSIKSLLAYPLRRGREGLWSSLPASTTVTRWPCIREVNGSRLVRQESLSCLLGRLLLWLGTTVGGSGLCRLAITLLVLHDLFHPSCRG
ncbi:hypothetical protein SK128_011430 [Halocaridina rubra]|uniref:Uncharacterized protein n=1 Tax=Halocaridina rubra TaxID=373956 RepID=A0AAN8XK14_HALRR